MSSITLVQAQAHLDEWLKADLAASQGRHSQVGDRILTQNDGATIRENVQFWQLQVNRLQNGGGMKLWRPEL